MFGTVAGSISAKTPSALPVRATIASMIDRSTVGLPFCARSMPRFCAESWIGR